MDWDSIKASFEDELEKISEISLMGLAPTTALSARVQEPIETPGLSKAKEALTRSSSSGFAKTASAKNTNKKYIAPGLQGAATGALLASLVPGFGKGMRRVTRNKDRIRLGLAMLGAGVNIMSKQSAASPSQILKSEQRVGKFTNKLKQGPKLSTQIRGSLVGQKGTLSGV